MRGGGVARVSAVDDEAIVGFDVQRASGLELPTDP